MKAKVTRSLEQPELLWRDLTVWFEDIAASIERDLSTECGLTGPEFQVLAVLADAIDGSLDQLDLRQELHWSPSRLSHQLRRMRTRGFCATTEAGHGTRMRVALTPKGKAAHDVARDVHERAVRVHLLDNISSEHRAELSKAVARGRSRMRTKE
ncbi:MAG: MarR family winged helix-turn-helix transcriptional regulator [Actinomycetales bacterium]|jgi:DNA-binding MarR family transcriptional regulator|nr:MarR family winged helix-turn-helix transcriptional regulator [Leifsonia sp.]